MALRVSDTLTVEEAAKYLDMTTWNVYRLVSMGEIRAYKLGKRLRFRQQDLDAFMKPRSVLHPRVLQPVGRRRKK